MVLLVQTVACSVYAACRKYVSPHQGVAFLPLSSLYYCEDDGAATLQESMSFPLFAKRALLECKCLSLVPCNARADLRPDEPGMAYPMPSRSLQDCGLLDLQRKVP